MNTSDQNPPSPPSAAGRIAFITGCGRSGTTILGNLLGQHPHIRYLNDRFDLWIRPFPFTDIWGRRISSATSNPRVALTARDADVPAAAKSWFYGLINHERGDRSVVIEKLAINNFRLGFITALCPEAKVINIVRHGVEVAYSIEQKALLGHWYGSNDSKWKMLVEYAWAHGYGKLVELCKTPYERGLLEWRMSVEAAEKYFSAAPADLALKLRFEDLLADAPGVCGRALSFLGLEPSTETTEFAQREIRRQTPPAAERPIPASTDAIAGPALRQLGYSF